MLEPKQTANERILTEARDLLKREQAKLSFRAASKDERDLIVREYAEMIDRLYPAKRFYIGPKDMPEPRIEIVRNVINTYTPTTEFGSHWRKFAMIREYPNVQF